MNKTLSKYKIGLGVLGAFVLALLITVLVQASSTRQDKQTYKRANEIATKLNPYTLYQDVPDSLKEIGVRDVPDTISYKKLSASKYQFCVTYNSASGFSASDASNQLISAAFGVPPYEQLDSGTDDETTYLSVYGDHKKGENCRVVRSYNYPDSNNSLYRPYEDQTLNN